MKNFFIKQLLLPALYLFFSFVLGNAAYSQADYVDAPNSYGTLSASGGASNTIAGPYLGASAPDDKSHGQPNSAANGHLSKTIAIIPSANSPSGSSYSTLVDATKDNAYYRIKTFRRSSGISSRYFLPSANL